MIEKVLEINSVNPLDIFGPNNKKLGFIRQFFPKLKIVDRGSKLIVMGEEEVILQFEIKFDLMLQHIAKYQNLTNSNIERIILEGGSLTSPLFTQNFKVERLPATSLMTISILLALPFFKEIIPASDCVP